MESTSLPMQIQISETTVSLLQSIGGYQIVERGTLDIKVGHLIALNRKTMNVKSPTRCTCVTKKKTENGG